MARRIREHLRRNVVGYVALFFTMSMGTAYATHPGGADTISSGDIINDNVNSADVRDDTLANGGLQAVDLRADSVGTSEVATDAIGSDEVAPDSLAAADLAPDSVGNSELGANSVTGGNVFPSSLSGADIQGSSLTGSDIAADSLTGADIATGAVGSSEVADESLGTAEFASSIPAAKVTRTADQSIPSRTTPLTALTFNAERYDTAGLHSPTVNLSHLRAPVTGIYQLTASINWRLNDGGFRDLTMFKNGNTFLAKIRDKPEDFGGTEATAQSVSTVAQLAAGDFVQVGVAQQSGGNLDVLKESEFSPEFSMTWLAPGP